MEKFLDIRIEDKFKVELGLVITGIIDVQYYGELEAGNYLEFKIDEEILTRKIIDVDYFTLPIHADINKIKTRNVGLLIACDSKEELNKILEIKLIRQTGIIYKNAK